MEDNGIVFLKVQLEGTSKPLNFVLDTGAAADLLDSGVAKSLGLKPNHQQAVTGAGGTKTYDVILNQQLALEQGIRVEDTNLVLTDLSHLNRVGGRKSYGIIGYSLLRKFITLMDYENKRLVLYKDIKEVDLSDYKKIPFQFDNGIPIPQFDIAISLSPEEVFRGKVFFDSGAGITLLINSPFNNMHQLNEKASKSLITKMTSLNEESFTEQILIQSLDLGEFSFGEMPATISHDHEGVSAYKGYLGILGAAIIKRFHIVLDYRTKTLYLKPNALHAKPFDFPVSGIRLVERDNGIFIDHVDKSSPAYQLGLRVGDELLAINQNTSGSLQTYKSMLKEEGAALQIVLRKPNGKEQSIQLKLMRLL